MGGTFTTPEALASYLDQLNNLGCPLNNAGELQSSSSRQSADALTSVLGDKKFAISGYPNPSRAGFSIQISGLATEKVAVKVTDMNGRLIEQRTNLAANQVVSLGNNYRAGMYYIEVAQGDKKQQLKMVKQ